MPDKDGHLFTYGSSHGDWKRPDVTPAQVLPLPLVTKELQLPLLLVIQSATISHLEQERGIECPCSQTYRP